MTMSFEHFIQENARCMLSKVSVVSIHLPASEYWSHKVDYKFLAKQRHSTSWTWKVHPLGWSFNSKWVNRQIFEGCGAKAEIAPNCDCMKWEVKQGRKIDIILRSLAHEGVMFGYYRALESSINRAHGSKINVVARHRSTRRPCI